MAEDTSNTISSPVFNPSDEAGDLALLAGIDLPIKDDSGFALVDENNEAVAGIFSSPTPAPVPAVRPVPVERPQPRQPVVSRPTPASPQPRPSFAPRLVPPATVSEPSAALASYQPFAAPDHAPHPLLRKPHPEISSVQKKTATPSSQAPQKRVSSPQAKQGIHLDQYAEEEIKKYLAVTRGVGASIPELPRAAQKAVAAARMRTAPLPTPPAPSPVSAPTPATPDSITMIIERIIAQAQLTFADVVQRSRFVTLVRSRLRDVRDKFELADGLMRPEKIGGLGYPEHRANEIAEMVEGEALHYLGLKTGAPSPTPVRKAPPVTPMTAQPKPVPSPAAQLPQKDTTYRSAVLDKLVDLQKIHKTSTVGQKKSVSPRREAPLRAPQKVPSSQRRTVFPQVIRPTITTDHRPTMMDVQQPQMIRKIDIMGPIDELAHMTLVNFRRLGVTAEMRTQKIREKIELLEQDSFALRSQGVEAWKNSEVNRLYLTLGQESIVKGVPVADMIRQKENEKQTTLSWEEFNSVADLNKSLRY